MHLSIPCLDQILYQGLYQALRNVNVEQVISLSNPLANCGSRMKSYVPFQAKVLLITSIIADYSCYFKKHSSKVYRKAIRLTACYQ